MTRMDNYKREQKRKVLAILDEMAKGIRSGRLVVTDYGFWDSRLNNAVNFRFIVLSRDSAKEIKKFESIS